MAQPIQIVLLVLLVIVVFLFASRCKLSCRQREGLYLSANAGDIMLGEPGRPSAQLLQLETPPSSSNLKATQGSSIVLLGNNNSCPASCEKDSDCPSACPKCMFAPGSVIGSCESN